LIWGQSLISELRINEKIRHYLVNAILGIVAYLPFPNNVSCLPNKLFKYMASGLPVIASNFDLCREVVRDADFGRQVNPWNSEEIVDTMEEKIKNPEELEQMSRNVKNVMPYFNCRILPHLNCRIAGLCFRAGLWEHLDTFPL
jgi:glycosyltransferase involved in cell wall biosynthesis